MTDSATPRETFDLEEVRARSQRWRTTCYDTERCIEEIDRLRAALSVLPARREGEAVCAICGKPATCIGEYETCTGVDAYACDACCGHGNEDGHCQPIAARSAADQRTWDRIKVNLLAGHVSEEDGRWIVAYVENKS